MILAYLYRANRFLPLVLLCILLPSIAVLRLEEREFSDKEEKTAALQRKIDIFDRLAFDVRNIIETKVLGYEPLLCEKAEACIAEKSALEFQYRKKKNLLEHISFRVKKGEHIAVVGENGSGKSTLMKLLCGIYDCSDGEIRMNGLPVDTIPKKSMYRSFTAVEIFFCSMNRPLPSTPRRRTGSTGFLGRSPGAEPRFL